jgi:hypothetical protein
MANRNFKPGIRFGVTAVCVPMAAVLVMDTSWLRSRPMKHRQSERLRSFNDKKFQIVGVSSDGFVAKVFGWVLGPPGVN